MRVEICQFTKIARTDLDVYFLYMNISLGIHDGNQKTPTEQLSPGQLPLYNISTLTFLTGQFPSAQLSPWTTLSSKQLLFRPIPTLILTLFS